MGRKVALFDGVLYDYDEYNGSEYYYLIEDFREVPVTTVIYSEYPGRWSWYIWDDEYGETLEDGWENLHVYQDSPDLAYQAYLKYSSYALDNLGKI